MTDLVTIHEVARRLPPIEALRDLCQVLAALDIVQYPASHGYRDQNFEREWRPGAAAASMRTGSGDGYLVAFTVDGAIILGFDHESEMSPYSFEPLRSWPGVLENVPAEFARFISEPPDFMDDDVPLVTACTWRAADGDRWRTGADIVFPDCGHNEPDGAGWLFALLIDPRPEAYVRDRQAYGRNLPVEAVRHMYELKPLTHEIARSLNPEAPFEDTLAELEQIGYPIDRTSR
ncbi:hypothetical protein [Kitasatospora sp. NPDC017646]|uniref:hypothetical protein n=1 Tax=Kitasatospora sp. NPDC017646 TaxID=3364024 RepID=UPI00378B66CC